MKKSRDCTKEYKIAEKAAGKNFIPHEPIDIGAYERAAYMHGYAQCLRDVADGKIVPPQPKWID